MSQGEVTGTGSASLPGKERREKNSFPSSFTSESVSLLPNHVIEDHPLVQELRASLKLKEVLLAEKDREIARLEVALAFGLKKLPP